MNPVQRLASVISNALCEVESLVDAGHIDILLTGFEDDIRKIRARREYGEHRVPIGNAHAIARMPVSQIERIPALKDVPIETRRAALVEIHTAIHTALDDDETDSD